MSFKQIKLSADRAVEQDIATGERKTKVGITVTDVGTLGGGTLNLLARPANSELSFTPIATAVAFDSHQVVEVGDHMEIGVELTGSASPDLDIRLNTF